MKETQRDGKTMERKSNGTGKQWEENANERKIKGNATQM